VFIVDDDGAVRDSLALLLASAGMAVETYGSARAFLERHDPARPGCVVLDLRMPDMDGLELQAELAARGSRLPVIFVSAHGEVALSARAFKAGAVDFLQKPIESEDFLATVEEALRRDAALRREAEASARIGERYARLTPREREVLELVIAGRSNKEIARALALSHRTVETHRARIMEKMEVASLSELVKSALLLRLSR